MKKYFGFVCNFAFVLCFFVSCSKNGGNSGGNAPKSVKGKISVGYEVDSPSGFSAEEKIPDSLFVDFYSSAAKLDFVYKDVSDFVSISPEISGKWRWQDDSRLAFIPNSGEIWAAGTKYKVSMSPSIFSDKVSVKKDFYFSTENFYLDADDTEFYVNPENPDEKRVVCTVNASHTIDKNSVKDDLISLTMNYTDSKGKITKSESIGFKISYNDDFSSIYIVSDVIKIPPYTTNVDILIKKGISPLSGKEFLSDLKCSVLVPGMSDYVKINEISTSPVKNARQSYDQMLVIETEGMISADELLNHIRVYELPKDRPQMEGWKAEKDFFWSAEFVTDEILALSKKIEITALPAAEQATSLNSFIYNATPKRFLYVSVFGDLNFFGGYKLHFDDENPYNVTLKVPQYPKELGIMSEGAILSLSGSKKLALYSCGFDKVYYKLSRIMPKDVNHLVAMSNGDLKNFKFDSYNFNEDNIGESEYSSYVIPNSSDSELSYFSYDFSDKLAEKSSKNLSKGLFVFQVADSKYKLTNSYNYQNYCDRRLILITDIGFVVKRNVDFSADIFVQSISTGMPLPYAKIKVIGLNGNTIVSTVADSSAHAKLPTIKDYTNEHTPVAYVVEYGNDFAFMPYSDSGRVLDFSDYDVGGEYGKADPEKISAYMFSDRGMYRPGETVHLGVIAKAGDWNIDLRGVPVEAEVINSSGAVIFNKKFQLSSSGFEEIEFATQDYSPTGHYTAVIYLVKQYKNKTERIFLTQQSIEVEEFLPDTLSVSTGFLPLQTLEAGGWINPQQLKGTVSVKNLFGTPAAGNNVKAMLVLQPGFPFIKNFSDWIFSDPYYKGKSFDEYLGTLQTDENGEALFDLDLENFEKAAYKLNFYAECFEKNGGRSVSGQSSLYVSPLKYLIGYKPNGKLSYINKDDSRKISLIAINQNLETIDLKDVSVQIEEIRYISTLVKQSNGLYKYQSVKKTYPVLTQIIDIPKNGGDFVLPSDIPGEYKLTLKDGGGLVYNTVNYTIVGDKNVSRSLTASAQLELKLENSDIKPGSDAQIFIKSPYAGSGLITVERDHIYNYKWFKTDEFSTVQTITIPKELEGNGYITVTFVRNSNSEEIFMNPLCYGTVPFSVDKENRINKITLNAPDEIKSGTDLKIEYSTKEPAKIVIMAVDEGILQLANHKTPDPIAEFFIKRALEVRTSQTLDLVLPDYNILQTLSATGGGAEMEALISNNLNPFKRGQNKAVAFWSGILDSTAETKSVNWRIPDYFNGKLRIMAVSVSKEKMSSAEIQTYARNTFIISPNVPLAVSPADEFDVSVTVTNNHKNSKDNKIILKAEPSEHFEIIGEKTKELFIAESKDETVKFKVKAKDKLGGAQISFVASDSTESSVLTSTLSVRPLMPYQTWINSGVTKKSSVQVDVNKTIYDEFAKRNAGVSNVPVTFLQGLSFYLEDYPYGCSEQITSKAYPYLYEDFLKATGKNHSDAEKIVNETIAIIQSRMKSDGNIGYWTSKSEKNPLITLYCAEFLIDAENKGYYVPSTLSAKIQNAVKNIIKENDDSNFGIYLRSYGIFVLTKAEFVTTSYIEKLENDITRKNFNPAEYEGLYLAASYAMLKQDKKADEILKKINTKKIFDSSWVFHNDLHYIATYIDVIASYFPQRINDIKSNEINKLCDYLTISYYNTYSTSATIRAMESLAYEEKSGVYKVFEIFSDKTKNQLDMTGESVLKGEFSSSAEKISFENSSGMPLFYQTVTAGYEKQVPQKSVKNGLEILREYYAENGEKISEIKLGDTVSVKISFRSLKGVLNNIAIIDLLPAGFEAEIQSIRDNEDDADFCDWTAENVDIREDRVVIYGTVTEKANSFEYKVKAANSGNFNVPPIYAESMYNKEIFAISPAPPIVILP